MNTEKNVGMKIISHTLSLHELERRFGPAGPSSHDRGDLHPNGREWNNSVWCVESTASQVDLAMQCSKLIDAVKLDALDSEAAAILDISLYFESAYATVALPATILHKLGKYGISIEITCYPVQTEGTKGDGSQ